MKKAIWSAIVIVIIILIVVMVNTNSTEQEPIKIGAILAQTGKVAAWGEPAFNGIELAVEEVNANGGINGRPLEVIYEDNQSEVAKGVSAYNKLVNIDGVSGLICMTSSLTKAIAPLTADDGVPTIAVVTGLTDITHTSDYLFRIWTTGKDKALALKESLEQFRGKKVGIITANNESPLDMGEQLKNLVLPELEIEIAFEDFVDKTEMDLRTVLSKMKLAEPDVIFVNLYPGQIGVGTKQLRDLGVDKPKFGSNVAYSTAEVEKAEGSMEGMWLPGDPVSSEEFLQKYRAKYGVESEKSAPAAYDAVMMFAKAMENAGDDREAIRNKLVSIDSYDGVLGTFRFDENGDSNLIPILRVVENGEFVSYK